MCQKERKEENERERGRGERGGREEGVESLCVLHACRCPQRAEESVRTPGTDRRYSYCERPEVAVRN